MCIQSTSTMKLKRQLLTRNQLEEVHCIAVAHKLQSSTKKLEFVEYLFRCSHNFTLFFSN